MAAARAGRLRPARLRLLGPVLRPGRRRGDGQLPGAYRYTGAALTSDLAWLIGAGFAPLVALGLSAYFGLAM